MLAPVDDIDHEAAGEISARQYTSQQPRFTVFALIAFMLWSLAVQVLRITQAYFLGIGLGIAVPYSYYLLFMPIGLLMLLLPISISGFGVPQGIIVWLLRPDEIGRAHV